MILERNVYLHIKSVVKVHSVQDACQAILCNSYTTLVPITFIREIFISVSYLVRYVRNAFTSQIGMECIKTNRQTSSIRATEVSQAYNEFHQNRCKN
jgi:hypothetical protein